MDAAKELQATVKETIAMAVQHLFPKVRELVARQILSQFEDQFGLPTTKLKTPRRAKAVRKAKPRRKPTKAKAKAKAKAKVVAKPKRKHLTKAQMQCKHPSGCEDRSKGPRYGYLCAKHQPKTNSTRPNLRVVPYPRHNAGSKIKDKAPRKAA